MPERLRVEGNPVAPENSERGFEPFEDDESEEDEDDETDMHETVTEGHDEEAARERVRENLRNHAAADSASNDHSEASSDHGPWGARDGSGGGAHHAAGEHGDGGHHHGGKLLPKLGGLFGLFWSWAWLAVTSAGDMMGKGGGGHAKPKAKKDDHGAAAHH